MAPKWLHVFGVFVAVVISTAVVVQAQEYFITERTYSVREGDGDVRVRVQRVGTGDGSVRLRLEQVNANPATAEDYDTSDIQLDFTGSETSIYHDIGIVDDGFYEGDGETFEIQLVVIDSSPGNGRSGEDTSVVTILDNDSLFNIDESESDLLVHEDDGVATITIMRVGYLPNAATVSLSTDENANADEGEDYTGISNRLVSFGQNIATQTVDVEILNDALQESESEIFAVILSNPTNGEIGNTYRTDVTISNDDGVYEFSTATYVVSEAANSISVCVTRTSENTLQQRTVLLSTIQNTAGVAATPNGDYSPLTTNTGKLVFGAGDNIECVDITILGDTLVENSETFLVEITELEGELGDTYRTTVTITDDDASFSFQQEFASVSENAGSIRVTVLREGFLQSSGTVRVTSSAFTASSPQDFTSVNSFESFSSSVSGVSSQIVTVDIHPDREDETDEVFYLDLVSPTGGTLGTPSRITITILDNDNIPPTESPDEAGVIKLSGGAIAGIVAAALAAVAAILGLCAFMCCMMGCPCCPWCARACGRQQQLKQPLVEQRPPHYYQQPPVTIIQRPIIAPPPLIQPVPIVQTMEVPFVEYIEPAVTNIVPYNQYNASF